MHARHQAIWQKALESALEDWLDSDPARIPMPAAMTPHQANNVPLWADGSMRYFGPDDELIQVLLEGIR